MDKEQEVASPQPRSAVEDLLGGLVESATMTELKEIEKNKSQDPGDTKKEEPAAKEKKTDINQSEKKEDSEEEEDSDDSADKAKKEDKKSKEAKVEKPKSEKADPEDEEEEDESEEEEEEDQPELKNKFGIKLEKKQDKKSAKLDIKSFDDLPSVLKTKYGQEIKDIKALPKFFETVDKWRSDSQSLEKVTKEKDNAIAVFEQLPPDLLDAIKMHYDGQDFRKAFEGDAKIDFSKPVEKHKSKALVNAFFPGEFTDEDFEAEEVSRELKIAIKASEKEYNTEKSAREQRAKNHVENAKRKSEAYKASIAGSVSALKSAFPNMAEDVRADVEQTLSNSGALIGEFFNPDGTYKPHAAKMFMLAKHGEDLIEDLMAIAQRRGESSANEEIVKRAPKTPKDKKGGDKTPERKEVTDTVNELLPQGLVNKRTF